MNNTPIHMPELLALAKAARGCLDRQDWLAPDTLIELLFRVPQVQRDPKWYRAVAALLVVSPTGPGASPDPMPQQRGDI